jgi:amino acid transporter
MADKSLEQLGYKQELKRSLGFWGVVVYGIIFTCPMASMQMFGYVGQYANGLDSLVYIIGVVGMIFTAFSYGRCIREWPIAGSVFSYVQRTINPHVGFVAGWLILIDYALIPGLVLSLAAVFVGILIPGIPVWLALLVFVLVDTAINYVGIELADKENIALFIIQLAGIAAFLVTGAIYVWRGGGAGTFNADPIFQPSKFNINFVASALSIAAVTLLGFDAMTTLAEETDRPQKLIPPGMIAVLLIIGLLFVSSTYIGRLIHPNPADLDPNTGFINVVIRAVGGKPLQTYTLIAFVLSLAFGTALNSQLAASRILYSMGRDKLIPGIFGKVHRRFKTPYVASITFGIVTFAIANLIGIEALSRLVNFGAMTSYMMLNAAVFWFFFIRKRQRGVAGFVWHFLFPLCGFIVIGYVWYGFDPLTKIVGSCWAVLGIIYGAVKSKGYRVVPEALAKLEI